MNDGKSDAMLAVDSSSAWYGAARILYDLSFEVGRGEVVATDGPQRRRQVHHAESGHGPDRRAAGQGAVQRRRHFAP